MYISFMWPIGLLETESLLSSGPSVRPGPARGEDGAMHAESRLPVSPRRQRLLGCFVDYEVAGQLVAHIYVGYFEGSLGYFQSTMGYFE